jgi:AcrR family transcriptional regulator
MRKPRPKETPANESPATSTRERIITAAIATLREDGFAGTSARSIARRGDFNQALIFYHFGTLIDLLVAALERVSADRLSQYQTALAGVTDLGSALSIARSQYEADVREGHITVLVELVAGASSVPQLAPEIVRCLEPWLAFTEAQIKRFLRGTALAALIPSRDAAQAVIALYLGMELLDHLDPSANTAKPLFIVAQRLHRAVDPLLSARPRTARNRPLRVPIDEARKR